MSFVAASLTNSRRFIHCDSISKLDHLEFIKKFFLYVKKIIVYKNIVYKNILYVYNILYLYVYNSIQFLKIY